MKILMINKFLYPNGGSETYIFKLGEYLVNKGHDVEYFGMEHAGRCVGNSVGAYTSDMDFHNASSIEKLSYTLRTIYSSEARKKIRLVLDDFKPDVCHLNNFNYQLTPSIILEIKKWSKETKRDCKIVYTAHDYQLVCPNHMCNNPNTLENCEKCLGGNFIHCTNNKCIHGSTLKSILGTTEALLWNCSKVYDKIDTIICCSEFLKNKLDTNKILAKKTITLHNFTTKDKLDKVYDKQNYALYFGRYSKEKGIDILLKACRELHDIQFVFAGSGDKETVDKIRVISNIKEVGFLSGEELNKVIREAMFSIYPSKWYENCPFSIIESQMLGTPVIGSNIGGIPELVEHEHTGLLFETGKTECLVEAINKLYNDNELREQMIKNCFNKKYMTLDDYYEKIIEVYGR